MAKGDAGWFHEHTWARIEARARSRLNALRMLKPGESLPSEPADQQEAQDALARIPTQADTAPAAEAREAAMDTAPSGQGGRASPL